MSLKYVKQANFEKIVIPPTCVWYVTYLMEYALTFTFASREFPRCAYGPLLVTTLIGLVTFTFDLLTSK